MVGFIEVFEDLNATVDKQILGGSAPTEGEVQLLCTDATLKVDTCGMTPLRHFSLSMPRWTDSQMA